jgi:PAS domain S-box-containing protein
MVDMLGYLRQELVGKTLLDIPAFEDGEAWKAIGEKLRNEDYVRHADLPVRVRSGQVTHVELVGAAYMVEGRRVIQCSLRDIADRKRAEEEKARLEAQLRQAQKMEAVGQLAGGVAHDFNNLLFVINGRAELAMNGLKADDPLRTQLKLIHETGGRAANLTRQLLAFSRRQALQPQILNLNTVVTDMSKMLFRLIREDITMKMVLCPTLRATKADPGQVEQVLMNLAVNARDAMPRNGTLTIETANVELDETYCRTHAEAKPGHYVMLAVSDTGCGMDEHVKARIFEPFFTTKEQGQGTGLGLATVYGIVKQSDGQIEVYSEVGKGTTLKIYLPETAETPARDAHMIKTIEPRGTETILLVEDEEDVRTLAAEILASKGYDVLLAGDGVEALSVCTKRKGKIDLIITDVVMPKMNGPEMAEKALGLRPGIRVLFMSGYTDGAIGSNGVLSSGTNYLQKPFTPSSLARKVREVLECTAVTIATTTAVNTAIPKVISERVDPGVLNCNRP